MWNGDSRSRWKVARNRDAATPSTPDTRPRGLSVATCINNAPGPDRGLSTTHRVNNIELASNKSAPRTGPSAKHHRGMNNKSTILRYTGRLSTEIHRDTMSNQARISAWRELSTHRWVLFLNGRLLGDIIGRQLHAFINEMPHNIAEADHTNKTAWLRVVGARHDNQTVHTTDLDEGEDGAKRVLGMTGHYTREVNRTLLERLSNGKVERLVRAKSDKGLGVVSCAPIGVPKLTMTSTVSYRLTTLPSLSTIGTALIPSSENMWTTSKTVVCRVAVAIGPKGCSAVGDLTYVPTPSSWTPLVRYWVMSRHCAVRLRPTFCYSRSWQ